jgi:hypothetical protein
VKNYPWFWRCAYLFSIVAQALMILAIICVFGIPLLWTIVVAAFILRAGIDLWGTLILGRKLEINTSVRKVLVADILTPFYLLIRVGLSLIPSHSWKGRRLQTVAVSD